jgi:excisionase family DNA binding protein
MALEAIDGYCTYQGAARLLGLSYPGIQKWCQRHQIQTYRLVGSPSILIRLSDLAQLRKTTSK